jgi:hypothetical protein
MFKRVWRHKMLFGVGLVALSIGFTGCGGEGAHNQPASSGQPAPSGQPPAASHSGSHSPAYNQGYEEGNQHMAPNISGRIDCGFHAGHFFNVARRDLDDWIQGCMDGIRDMNAEGQSGGPGTPTPSIDCSKPENRFNGACF